MCQEDMDSLGAVREQQSSTLCDVPIQDSWNDSWPCVSLSRIISDIGLHYCASWGRAWGEGKKGEGTST